MISKLFPRSALHTHPEPAQRVLGVAELAPDSSELAQLLTDDPAPQVRVAAARRCANLATLAAAWETETDLAVRDGLASALCNVLSETQDGAGARTLLEADRCTDAIRSEVARRTQDADRRHHAIAAIRDEEPLIDLALAAEHAETRMAAAERVRTVEGLRRLADGAKNKDNGVARLARQRIDAMEDRLGQAVEADAILTQLEALTSNPGPVLGAVVELNRRWQVLDMSGDTARLARCDAARRTLQARFDREQDEQRVRARFKRRLREWISMLGPPAAPDGLAALRTELAALREEAQRYADNSALAELEAADQRIVQWEQDLQALAGAEALVVEAEQLAAGTSIDHANLPERWQALHEAIRAPALTRRFDAALTVVEQRRLAQIRVAQQEANAARQDVHRLLHIAEQALIAGQLQSARAVADELKTVKGAGMLPKPTMQRLNRVLQQVVELERWESFGQYTARIQLCERAEAASSQPLDAPRLALEVRKLREEWKALDQQHAGVPKALWERFDRACEKAYAPAAKHFAQLAAERKQARKRRDEFIAAAAAHAPSLLVEPCDWRSVERWLRDTDHAWREGDLGSVEPGARKELDTRLKTVLAPLRDALSAVRDRAKADRQALIVEAQALASKAMERGAPSQVKAIQAKWQEQAKALPLAQHDERALWEQFRAACNAVFSTRQTKRKEEDNRKHEHRRALEDICVQLEQLALEQNKDDQVIRRGLRELQEQWKKKFGGSDPALRGIESRFKDAKTAVEAAVSARARSREAAVWQTLAAKERLCEELDSLVRSRPAAAEAATRSAAAHERWTALPALSPAWEQKMIARRDAALRALSEAPAASDYLARIEHGVESRRENLLELEILLGLESPAELQAQKLALQVKQLKERFQGAGTISASVLGERLVAWCAQPGIVDARDRQRCERVFSAMEQLR
ncbi:MAG: DUF349 domain-containing protein [Betaproteobacteria bacterium]|nr:MAG: DUF349 domain-containing protein [Betaproteobacteria bacterium]